MNNSDIHILVVEDESELKDILVMIFEDEGYQVDSAENGSQAIELLSARHYQILVTDLFMPVMTGIELIKKSREMSPDTKVILISGGGKNIEAEHGKESIKFKGDELKVDRFMQKPYKLDEILDAVNSLV